ncbi:putative ABC transport system permease protein [Ruminococcus flavefaciens]|uniref:Putative ABC transport system permease protein n=1 Tax=Ruminococcus flavefaciens TaxID=1265 RepID=A0A1H6KAK8_RUMFL|nr:FtsX-like permease family protein [Ruminococcus flavefaciens]SEH72242.1 putative ABC transport system permease protein [Ruminococcus flavefaciens]
MEKKKISFGKRPKDPLRKRVWKDMLRDWKRYLMICLMLIVTIGFVSGMYVANNSMLNKLDNSIEDMKREDGHFALSKKADEATVKAIETGERADVAAVYRERAYDEAADEVEKAVNEAMEETVAEQVREAIKAQVTAAADEQIEAAKVMGAEIPEAERESMISSAYETAIAENYDKAYDDAIKTAKDSEDYSKALSDAMDEAKKEIDKEIDEKYSELAERYGLNEETTHVPVTVYELFYKDADENIPSDSEYSGTIRVYGERGDIDLYDILKGRAPANENEIIIDRMHADNVKIKVGDTLSVGDTDFEVVGLAAFVDYSALYENNTDTMFDALTFDIGMTTKEGFERIHANTTANYAFTYNKKPADEYEEKEMSENFLKALITQTAVSDTENMEIKDYVPAYANQAMSFARNDIGKDKAMGEVLLYILTAVLAFIFAVNISTTLEQESSVIGTLRASGYTRGELLRYYMSAPLLIVIMAAVIGNILGYTMFKNIVADMYYSSYSLPSFETMWTPEAFIRTTIVPTVLMLVINVIVITKMLKLSPLRFLRHDLKRKKRKKAIRLPKWKFFKRFRIRVFLQNIPNYIMLFVGITFVMLLISMAVGMPETLSYYQDSMGDMMFAEDQLILSSTEDEDGNIITTANSGAERFSIASLERRSDDYNEEVSVLGIVNGSRYVKLNKCDDNEVYISKAYAEKYGVSAGDTITLSEKYEHKDYKWKVHDIYDYSAGVAVFMENEQFNRVFDKEADDFSGYISNSMITDISKEYIAKEITSQDMIKVADQLDKSMGAYMKYFQYVCFIVAAIILYLLTKVIIEKNERSISMTKILGYENGEIASLYLIPTALVVFFSEFLAIYIGYKLMDLFWKLIMMQMSGWFAFILPVSGFVKEFLLVFAAYLIITVLDFIRIRKIPKVLALKNAE